MYIERERESLENTHKLLYWVFIKPCIAFASSATQIAMNFCRHAHTLTLQPARAQCANTTVGVARINCTRVHTCAKPRTYHQQTALNSIIKRDRCRRPLKTDASAPVHMLVYVWAPHTEPTARTTEWRAAMAMGWTVNRCFATTPPFAGCALLQTKCHLHINECGFAASVPVEQIMVYIGLSRTCWGGFCDRYLRWAYLMICTLNRILALNFKTMFSTVVCDRELNISQKPELKLISGKYGQITSGLYFEVYIISCYY